VNRGAAEFVGGTRSLSASEHSIRAEMAVKLPSDARSKPSITRPKCGDLVMGAHICRVPFKGEVCDAKSCARRGHDFSSANFRDEGSRISGEGNQVVADAAAKDRRWGGVAELRLRRTHEAAPKLYARLPSLKSSFGSKKTSVNGMDRSVECSG
jgi:hypothetical protein